MRYEIQQKFFALADSYIIRNGDGDPVYQVKGRWLSIGDKLSFQDMEGNELALIREKLLSWGPSYVIEQNGKTTHVKKHLFTFFKCRFTVDVPGPDDIEASGSLLDYEYTFERDGDTVAEVSKRWFAFRDRYGVEIAEGENAVLILASTVVIDLVCHGEKKDEH